MSKKKDKANWPPGVEIKPEALALFFLSTHCAGEISEKSIADLVSLFKKFWEHGRASI
jgi:hypothetical protein